MLLLSENSKNRPKKSLRKTAIILATLLEIFVVSSCKKTNEDIPSQKQKPKYIELSSDIQGDKNFEQGRIDSSIYYYRQGIPENMENLSLDEKYTVAMRYVNMGIFYRSKTQFNLAIDNIEKSRTFFESQEAIDMIDDSVRYAKLSFIYKEIAQSYIEKSNDFDSISYVHALEYSQKSYTYDTLIGNTENLGVHMLNLSVCYLGLKNREQEKKYSTLAENIFTQSSDRSNLSGVHNNNAIVYRENKQYLEGIIALKKAIITLENCEKDNKEYKTKRKIFLCNLLELSLDADNKDEGELAYNKLLKTDSVDNEDLMIRQDELAILLDTYKHNPIKYHKDVEVDRRRKRFNDRIVKGQFIESDIRHQTGEKEKTIIAQKGDIEKQTQQKKVFLIIAAAFLALSSVIGLALKAKRKQNKILAEKNAEIEAQKKLVEEQKEIVEKKNKDITDGIKAAAVHQNQHLLMARNILKKYQVENFIFHQPHSIVGGDFYWATEKNGKIYVLTADCTGHGVRGAFMSQAIKDMLNEVVNRDNVEDPGSMFDMLRNKIILQNKQQEGGEAIQDGMDATLCVYDFENKSLQYTGAKSSVWILRKNAEGKYELGEYKGDKQPVGEHMGEKPFSTYTTELKSGDIIYTFSDGFQDQFGGPDKKKFMKYALRELLLSLHDKPMKEQQKILNETFQKRKGDVEQTDDVLVIGIKIP